MQGPQLPSTPAARAEHVMMAFAALLLPSASLVPLGGLWLWEKGWLLWWALAAFACMGAVFLIQHRILRAAIADEQARQSAPAGEASELGADPRWSPTERAAWRDVRAIAAGVDLDTLADGGTAWIVAAQTIEAVARRLHPGSHDAVWQFTMPEAMAISERVSRRLGRFVATHIPFGERLTVSQILTLYRARHIVDVAGRAYDVWRLLRLVNPATAITHEARERLTKALFNWGREHVSRRLVDAYVEEVGRAAIDLYGGRLRTASSTTRTPQGGDAHGQHAAAAETPPSPDADTDQPLPRKGTVRQAASAVSALARALLRRNT